MKRIFLSFATVLFLALMHETAQAATTTILMSNFAFSPVTASIGVGDTVVWTNTAFNPHTSTRGDVTCGTNGFGSTFWDSASLNPQGTYTKTFTNFAPGTYTYVCTIHCSIFGMKGTLIITNPPNVPPTVAITNPPSGTKFPALANITLQADAGDVGGSVTNVQFLSGAGLLGSDDSAPFAFTVNNAAAGNYNFTAIAADNLGTLATSAVVNVFVLTNPTLTAIAPIGGGQFQITVSGISGQTYATEASTNFQGWSAFATNVAPADIFNVTDSVPADALRFYRARQDF